MINSYSIVTDRSELRSESQQFFFLGYLVTSSLEASLHDFESMTAG